MHKFENGLDVGGCGDGLVAVAAEVGVRGVGHVVVARCAVLDIEIFPARVVHELVLADARATLRLQSKPVGSSSL